MLFVIRFISDFFPLRKEELCGAEYAIREIEVVLCMNAAEVDVIERNPVPTLEDGTGGLVVRQVEFHGSCGVMLQTRPICMPTSPTSQPPKTTPT